jgi:hypothetical protein
MPEAGASRRTRGSNHAKHRAHSYYHEIIVDLGYYAPLHHLARRDAALRLIDFAALRMHVNVPAATRAAQDPLLVTLGPRQMRLDGTPHVLVRTMTDGRRLAVGIPGIQVDRGTETLGTLAVHLHNAIEFIADGHHARLWGFDTALIPFLFTKASRMAHAMALVARETGATPFLLFKTIPDIGLLPNFPKPCKYQPAHPLFADEPPPDGADVFATPWQRVGYPAFDLATFADGASP